MDQYLTADIAWQRTVGQLDAGCAHELTARVKHLLDSHGSSSPPVKSGDAAIALLDRPSSRTATVSWSDPRGCKYGEQVWRLATAKRSGICALSGQPIGVGDAIYRPTKANPPPANAAAMMLAKVAVLAFTDQCCQFWPASFGVDSAQIGTPRQHSRCGQWGSVDFYLRATDRTSPRRANVAYQLRKGRFQTLCERLKLAEPSLRRMILTGETRAAVTNRAPPVAVDRERRVSVAGSRDPEHHQRV